LAKTAEETEDDIGIVEALFLTLEEAE